MKKIIVSVFSLMMLFISTFSFAGGATNNEIKSQVPPLSVQLWSVKKTLEKDYDGTLKALADMGFKGVELAGNFGPYSENAFALKQKLNSLGLKASAAHVPIEKFEDSLFEKTVLFYKTLDVDMLIIPWDEKAWHPEGIFDVVKYLNELSAKLAPYGMRIGFHNHDQEFNDFQQSTYWDYIAQNTPDSVILQLDVAWTKYAGKSPIEYVNRYPNRTLLMHYKVRFPEDAKNKLPIIGQDEGKIDWLNLLKATVKADTKWIVVEQEQYPNGLTPLEAVAASKRGLEVYIDQL